MRSQKYPEKHTLHAGSDRQFGMLFSLLFLVVALLPLRAGGTPHYGSLLAGILIGTIALWRPSLLAWPNRIWLQFGRVLHRIVSPVVLALFYFVLFTPYAVVIRLFRKDVLKLGREPERGSYWQQRTEPPESLQRQF